jgi:hypothetical protein
MIDNFPTPDVHPASQGSRSILTICRAKKIVYPGSSDPQLRADARHLVQAPARSSLPQGAIVATAPRPCILSHSLEAAGAVSPQRLRGACAFARHERVRTHAPATSEARARPALKGTSARRYAANGGAREDDCFIRGLCRVFGTWYTNSIALDASAVKSPSGERWSECSEQFARGTSTAPRVLRAGGQRSL